MAESSGDEVGALRAFNRLYTARLGLLDSRFDGGPFSLSEARVLYELANRRGPTAAQIARDLGIDRAQISRTLRRFAERHLVEARADPNHKRQRLLHLTTAGGTAYQALEANTCASLSGLLKTLPPLRRRRLLAAAKVIGEILEAETQPDASLRGLRPGDMGLVTARQALLYSEEYGWNQDYETLVATILTDFQRSFDPTREAAWIAEIDGVMAGSIFLVRGDTPGVAKLRLLYVERDARGAGVGRFLVSTCIDRARAFGYANMELWTTSNLTAARSLYVRAGFQLIQESPIRSFGHDLVEETWSMIL